jgi:hypothetical protein
MPDHPDHVADQAGFIASLPAGDQQRMLAEEHARSCAACREALEEGSRFISILQRALSSPMTAGEPPESAVPPSNDTEIVVPEGTSRRLA